MTEPSYTPEECETIERFLRDMAARAETGEFLRSIETMRDHVQEAPDLPALTEPCPACGEAGNIGIFRSEEGCRPLCGECGCTSEPFTTPQDAADWWNTRPPDPVPELRTALVECLAQIKSTPARSGDGNPPAEYFRHPRIKEAFVQKIESVIKKIDDQDSE